MVASKPNVVATAAIRNHKVNGGGHLQRPTDIDHNPDVIPGGNTGLMHHVRCLNQRHLLKGKQHAEKYTFCESKLSS